MPVDRRGFLTWSGLGMLTATGLVTGCSHSLPPGKADYTLRIGHSQVEVAPGKIVSTTTYNGQFPGPLLRFTEGKQITVDVHNDTGTPQQLHWHGQHLPVEVDGSAEEGTPFIAAHGMRRISLVPGPAGFRFYHTHLNPGADLTGGQYGGLVGAVYIEPKHEPGAYDREVFLTLKEFEPSLSQGGDMPGGFLAGDAVAEMKSRGEQAMNAALAAGLPHGYEVGYEVFTVNGRTLGHGEPIRVKTGERVMLHVLNGSATENRSLALPGHVFTVVALDGNPVPKPVAVPVLWLGAAERISTIVEMNHPGVWILGDLSDEDRQTGMGTVIEYAGRTGDPQWAPPPEFAWDYRVFGSGGTAPAPDQVIDLLIEKRNAARDGFNIWTVNGAPYAMDTKQPVLDIVNGRRYRLRFRNATDDIHPMHLHRHTFEITHVAGTPTAGVRKDVAMLGGYQIMEVDFTADQPGLSLLHCHQQIHMDFGFMTLLRCS
ncbi:MAG: multicopper oxidase domain-containing protein [Mycobacterium pseudokansasii]|uniref:multicopper oxidase family protein n=1 Tax=Mycobacterium pseudokansasii TaxID=2341080 RepID=UPI0023F4D32F|nr:multicopper oxidase domain-containing protein [Mycobacterium pseudokansasii]MBY0387262.1 multicopper oxidase domain-containing protein [Mycobacterium pseudokansasii]